jgi:hypothetical protein
MAESREVLREGGRERERGSTLPRRRERASVNYKFPSLLPLVLLIREI